MAQQFIKSIAPDDPVVRPIMEAFGFDGYGRFIAVLDFCRKYKIETVDIQLIVNQAKSNKRGAAKLLPLFQECLTNVLVMFGEKLPNVSPKHSNNITESLPKLEGQNPHGSTRDLEKNREEKKEIREESSSSLPPIWEGGAEDADLKKKLDLVLVYKLSGERKTEYQWFKEQVIHELKRSNYRRINLLGGVQSLIASNAVVQKLGRFWIGRPKHERMAAIAFVIGNPNARHELSYAMSAIEKNYKDYTEKIPICEKAVSQNDLEVIVNA